MLSLVLLEQRAVQNTKFFERSPAERSKLETTSRLDTLFPLLEVLSSLESVAWA